MSRHFALALLAAVGAAGCDNRVEALEAENEEKNNILDSYHVLLKTLFCYYDIPPLDHASRRLYPQTGRGGPSQTKLKYPLRSHCVVSPMPIDRAVKCRVVMVDRL